MATAESVLAKIQALIDSANTTTGGSNTDLTAAINALIAGYNAGGIDTSDATATAEDIRSGVSAYVNGEKIDGSASDNTTTYTSFSATPSVYEGSSQNYITMEVNPNKAIFIKKRVFIGSNIDNFGDATAADVISGKTFTSSAGLKTAGTHVCSGGITPSGTIEITSNGTHDVTNYASATVNVPTGGSSGGLVAKSGSFTADNETSHTISTGLSSISYFIMKKDGSVSSTGFVIGSIISQGSDFQYAYCVSYSQYLKNFNYTTMSGTVSGGDFTYSGSSTSALTGTISWVAIGTE